MSTPANENPKHTMKALSIRQPWAWLVVHGYKDIENRTWPTNFRGRIFIHAGRRFDHDAVRWLVHTCFSSFQKIDFRTLHRGAIVGEVDIVDCVTQSNSPWFVGPYGFVLANPVAYDTPIPYKGRLGFFDVSLE